MSKYDGKFKIGEKINYWTIINNVPKSARLLCRCSCGVERLVQITNLFSGRHKSCGCYKSEGLIGKKFNKLTVIKKLDTKRYDLYEYECLCDCGNKKILTSYDVRSGRYVSCGCVSKLLGRNHPTWRGYEDISLLFFNSIKSSAIKRNIDFKITIEYLWNLFILQNKKCALSGTDLILNGYKAKGNASVDRINSDVGYVEGNVQWVYKDINIMKNGYSNNYFIHMCKIVSDNNNNFKYNNDNTYKFGMNK